MDYSSQYCLRHNDLGPAIRTPDAFQLGPRSSHQRLPLSRCERSRSCSHRPFRGYSSESFLLFTSYDSNQSQFNSCRLSTMSSFDTFARNASPMFAATLLESKRAECGSMYVNVIASPRTPEKRKSSMPTSSFSRRDMSSRASNFFQKTYSRRVMRYVYLFTFALDWPFMIQNYSGRICTCRTSQRRIGPS